MEVSQEVWSKNDFLFVVSYGYRPVQANAPKHCEASAKAGRLRIQPELELRKPLCRIDAPAPTEHIEVDLPDATTRST